MLFISAAYAVVRCLSVRPYVWVSVTFVHCVETSKYILKLFSPLGSHAILVFLYLTLWQPSHGDGASNAGGMKNRAISRVILETIQDRAIVK